MISSIPSYTWIILAVLTTAFTYWLEYRRRGLTVKNRLTAFFSQAKRTGHLPCPVRFYDSGYKQQVILPAAAFPLCR